MADRQYGHVTRRQLLALGVSGRWVRSQVQLGWLIPVHAGVYAVGHVPRHALARSKAALLACGSTAAISHRAAAALWEVGEWPETLEVSVIGYRRRPGVRVYRPLELLAHDVRVRQGLRVTSPVRTALDLRSQLTDARLVRLINDLRVAGQLGPGAIAQLRLRSARLERLLGDGHLTRSALEDLFRRFVTRHHLPMPEINTRSRNRAGGRRAVPHRTSHRRDRLMDIPPGPRVVRARPREGRPCARFRLPHGPHDRTAPLPRRQRRGHHDSADSRQLRMKRSAFEP